ncbi:MAG: class I SAM-dependent methyltransferase [Marinilabiliaceae bacterium]|nr:class I SAM-dependent methyltransferase [Marinilabiliaceae bacterium]
MIKKIYKKIFSERRRIKNILIYRKITSIFYRGNKLTCNCCGKSFRKFKKRKTKIAERKDVECPYCGSVERTRNLLFYIQNETNILNDKIKLLHFAPEYCLQPIFKKAKNLERLTADINPNYADNQIDITNITFPDNSFDYIICSHVLGHVPDEKKGITEMKRVLKPNGTALILTLIETKNQETLENKEIDTPEKRLLYYSEPDLMRLHGLDFKQRLIDGGFQVSDIDYRFKQGNEIYQKYALGDGRREIIFRCTKK